MFQQKMQSKSIKLEIVAKCTAEPSGLTEGNNPKGNNLLFNVLFYSTIFIGKTKLGIKQK